MSKQKQKTLPVSVIGIDVSKNFVDVCFLDKEEQERYTGHYDEDKLPALVKKIAKAKPNVVILEATGGYERVITAMLVEKGVPFRIVNPDRTRKFAQSIGLLGKSDKIDANMLALYALRNRIEPVEPPSEKRLEIQALLKRRRQLISLKVAELLRSHDAKHQAAAKSVMKMLDTIEEELQKIDALLDKNIHDDDEFREKKNIITSVPGVGTQTANALLGEMPELGSMSRAEAAALVGLAPFPQDSGKKTGKRSIRGGRFALRRALYMPTIAAIRCNNTLSSLYKRLVDNGKAKKVAIVACMRKLIVLLNALIKKGELYKI